MQYLGSKNKIAKRILPVILEGRRPEQWYVEPFVGGCNSIDKVGGLRLGNDINLYLIEMWKALQVGWKPPEVVTKEEYYRVKENMTTEEPALVGFVGFLCSFGGKWFGGYAANSKGDNYAARGARVLLKQIEKLRGVVFTAKSYWEMYLPPDSIVYCDPPYRNVTIYKYKIDHDYFWQWVRNVSSLGHQVFVSEYEAPSDFICLLEIFHSTVLDKNKKSKRVERLFKYNV